MYFLPVKQNKSKKFFKTKTWHDGVPCEEHCRWTLYCFSIKQLRFLSFFNVLTASYITYTISAYMLLLLIL